MIRVTEVKQTCYASPAQWEGKTDDNRLVYVRYRWGNLSISLSPPNATDISEAVRGADVIRKSLGNGFDGYLSYDALREATKAYIEWPDK